MQCLVPMDLPHFLTPFILFRSLVCRPRLSPVLPIDRLVLLSIFFLSFSVQAQYKVDALDTSCGGLPKVSVGTFALSCLGLVADTSLKDQATGETFRFPRKIVELEQDRYLVSDMGGWGAPKKGALWELDLRQGQKKLTKVILDLHLPHDLEWGPDGDLYIGELGKIVRYSKQALLNRQSARPEVVVEGLPTNVNITNLHPLVNFTFGRGQNDLWDLYVNIGAPSDACKQSAPNRCAVENRHAVIRHYAFQSGINRWKLESANFAVGLRNSMGLLSHSSGLLLQAENSRDFSEAHEPFDELNVIQKAKHYGWPYCYNFKATSPEWKNSVDCTKKFESPWLLFPPHSSPLDLVYYDRKMFPELQGNLLVSLHGHQPTGARIIAMPTDSSGLPIPKNGNSWEYSSGSSKIIANPEGGNLRSLDYTELVTTWWKKDGIRPAGSPVGLLVASDGSIFIVEDKNKTILRLVRKENVVPPVDEDRDQEEAQKKLKIQKAVQKLTQNKSLFVAYEWINTNIFQSTCVACHFQLKGAKTEAFEFMVGESWLDVETPGKSLLIKRLLGLDGLRKMPLGSSLPETNLDYVVEWVKAL